MTDIWTTIRTERLRMADELAELTPEQLAEQSQCEHWTIAEVAAHLVTPFETSKFTFLTTMIRSRGDFDLTIRRITAKVHARYSTAEIIDLLRTHADNRWLPPVKGAGPQIVLAEIVVHGYDIRRPLGLASTVPDAVIEQALAGVDDDDIRAEYAHRVGATPVVPTAS